MKKFELSQYDAIAFDFEGTLADTIPIHNQARVRAFEEHGYGHITPEQHARATLYGSYSAPITGGILHAAGEIDDTIPFENHPLVQAIIETRDRYFAELAATGFEAMPGAIDFVRAMTRHFMGRMAVVTSSEIGFVTPFLKRFELDEYFPSDRIIAAETVVAEGLRGKPQPDAYRLAMERLQSRSLLVFEDTPPGVEAAKRAGATVVALGFDDSSTKKFKTGSAAYPPDFLVHDYTEVDWL